MSHAGDGAFLTEDWVAADMRAVKTKTESKRRDNDPQDYK